VGGGAGRDVGGDGDRAGELDAQVVSVALDAGDRGRPDVAGLPSGWLGCSATALGAKATNTSPSIGSATVSANAFSFSVTVCPMARPR
jgi:hypothetical protein